MEKKKKVNFNIPGASDEDRAVIRDIAKKNDFTMAQALAHIVHIFKLNEHANMPADARMNAQLAIDYEKKIRTLNTRISELESQQVNFVNDGTVSELEKVITALEAEKTTLQKQLTDLQQQTAGAVVLEGKQYVFDPGDLSPAISRRIAYLIQRGKLAKDTATVMLQKYTYQAVSYYNKNAFDL